MIICISCKTDTKSKMDSMLSNSHYSGYSELVAVAINNLWTLEQEVAEKGALVIGEDPDSTPSVVVPAASSSDRVTKPLKPGETASIRTLQAKVPKTTGAPIAPAPARVPELFIADGLDVLSVKTAETPASGESEEVFTLDRWLFGQYNKLLPIKANCRALLRIAAEHRDGAPLENIAPQIGEAAALLGDYLAEHDRRHQIKRDYTLATAFPRSGPDAEKSRARYTNQFLGSVNSRGVLSGLLCDYRMAALATEAHVRLMLTEPGTRFARLTNPVLDSCQNEPAQKFTLEEATFLLNHIRAHVPVEAFAFRILIEAIVDGAVTPNKLDEALRIYVPDETKRSLSPSFLTSQRSGALSRMADLGLIARERRGVKVSYVVTEQGQRFIGSK